MKVCVIFNPTARGENARRFQRQLERISGRCGLKPTSGPGAARQLAAEAVREGFDTVVAAGGDGTVNEVLNGMGDEPAGFARACLGVLPLGTVNVFAKELGLPSNPRKAWGVVQRGREKAMDLPVVEFATNGVPHRRYFAQMAGAGLDARAIELVDWELKKKIAQFAYLVAGLKAMKGAHSQIECVGEAGSASGELVLIGNGRFYGGRLPVFAMADPTDGLLDACVFTRVNWATVFRYAVGFLTGRVLPPADMRRLRSARLILTSASPTPFEVEGEAIGHLPAVFSIQPKALRVLVP